MPDAIPAFVRDELAKLHIETSDEELARLAVYLQLLLEMNQKMNLTAVREPEAAWRRLAIDSLTALPLLADLPAGAGVVDVGSGGGLPGIPLAVARPDLKFTLIEATAKKARFLESCAAQIPLPNVRTVNARAETAGQDKAHRQQYDAAVCRAVGPMVELLELTLPLVKVGGFLLAMKGPSVEAELDNAGDAMMLLGAGELQVMEAYPESFGISTVLVRVSKESPTPKAYPRPPGTAKMSPL